MAKEIERKFLVTDDSYKQMSHGSRHIVQAYLSREPRATVRVRIINDSDAYLTIKGRNEGAVRDEWEFPIAVDDARQMIERCCQGSVIDKTRWLVSHKTNLWEVDEFHGARQGLVVAEIELPAADTQFDLPTFVGEEVTGDVRYYNSSL